MKRLLVGSLVAGLLLGCGGGSKDPLELLPEDTEYVAIYDVKGLRSSDVWKDAAKGLDDIEEEEFQEAVDQARERYDTMVDALGFDPIDDVDRVVAGMGLPGPGSIPAVAILEGKGFDADKLVEALEDEGMEVDDDDRDGITLYAVEEEFGFAVPDEKTLLIGEMETLEAALDLRAGKSKKSAADDEDLVAAYKRADSKAEIRIVAVINAILRMAAEKAPVKGLNEIRAVTVSADAGEGLALRVVAELSDADAAEDMLDTVEDGLDMVKEMLELIEKEPKGKKYRKQLEEMLESVEVKADKELLTVKIDLAADGVGLVGLIAAVAIPAFVKYIRKSKASEAHVNLRRLANSAASYYDTEHVSPTGDALPPSFPETVDWTPPLGSCCKKDGDKCMPDADLWSMPTWLALMFAVDSPYYYSYRFESDGTGPDATFKAMASGDLDCDGKYSVFEMGGSAGPDGVELTPAIHVEDELE